MPISAEDFEELRQYLVEAADVLGRRFLFGPDISGKKTDAGWHDAWFDASVTGLLKLNCFFLVPPKLFAQVKTTAWSPVVNQYVFRKAKARPGGHGYDKGARGTVICNGAATPHSLAMMSVLGTDGKDEHFETALYENELYKPPQLNLELKLVSNALGDRGKPVQAIVVNAHIDKR